MLILMPAGAMALLVQHFFGYPIADILLRMHVIWTGVAVGVWMFVFDGILYLEDKKYGYNETEKRGAK